ncbi:hypothetical protein BF17_18920 [Yersinia similis]|uniref:Uncharacterized protein n=1 Tax=Yersinia similis TaxID=367190 RepID=A0ABM5Q3T6_9GAMM|nr:hypothetical protein BF17_18920 [Yersinia similis]CFQ59318.1 Uncharacterised protein [Yersinia similis]
MKIKLIAVVAIIIIIVVLFRFFSLQEKATETPPNSNNTLYVQSNSPGECRVIITPILDGVISAPSEIPCKIQLHSND